MKRPEKGQSLLDFPKDYTVIDVETTGWDPHFDVMLEIAAVRMRNGEEVAHFETLLNPGEIIPDFIVELTGITNEELKGAPVEADIMADFRDFVQDDMLVGHNVSFDVNFLYDALIRCGCGPLKNDFVDSLRLGRRICAELEHHRLSDLAQFYSIPQPIAHRALADCRTTAAVMAALEADAQKKQIDINAVKKYHSSHPNKSGSRVADIVASSPDLANPLNPLYGKECVFTGKLEAFTRKEAAQIVVNLGGICADRVTKKTNYLIMGSNEYNPAVKDGKSSKQKKAEELILKGADLQVLSESVFLELLDE